MSFSIVSHTIAGSADNNTVTTPPISTVGSDFIALLVTTYVGGGPVPFDDGSNLWTPGTRIGVGDSELQFWWKRSPITGASHTFSVSATGTYPAIAVVALSGSAASPFDAENGVKAPGSSNTIATGSVSPTEDNEILLAGYSGYSSAITGIDSGFTILDTLTYNGHHLVTGLAYKIQTTKSAENPTWSLSAFNVNAGGITAFKSGAVVPGGGFAAYRQPVIYRGLGLLGIGSSF